MTSTATRLAATTIAGLAAVALVAPSAHADVYEHFTFRFTDEPQTFDDCGFPIVRDFSIKGSTVLRTVKGTQTLFFSKVTFQREEVLTNPVTGAWFRVTANETYKEGGPVQEVAPGVYTYTVRESGRPMTVWDSSGHQVASDRGLMTFQFTFDTGGDAVPGGTELDSRLVSVRGPHPLLDSDFCQIATSLIG